MLKKLWNDPVWSAVLATVIVAVGGAIGTYLLGLWPTIAAATSKIFGYLSQSSTIPNWLLLVISISALPTILFIIALVWHRLKPYDAEQAGDSHANWRTYTTDTFYGLRWRWNYYGGKVSGLHTFCPYCDYQVFPMDVSAFRAVDHIAFKCDSCGRNIAEFQEPYSLIESKVERFIHQKIRNNTWSSTHDA